MVPSLVEIPIFLHTCLLKNKIIMTGEPMHTASKEKNGAAINYHLKSEVSFTLCCQLCSTHYTALRMKKYLK